MNEDKKPNETKKVDYKEFRELFVKYAAQSLTYIKNEVEDEDSAKDLFFRSYLKIINTWKHKPENVPGSHWILLCINGELRRFFIFKQKTDKSYTERVDFINDKLHSWITPFQNEVQEVILQLALEFYSEANIQESFSSKVDFFEAIDKAKKFFEDNK